MRLNVYTAPGRLHVAHVWYVSTQMRHVVESDHHVVRLERALSDSVVVRCMQHACGGMCGACACCACAVRMCMCVICICICICLCMYLYDVCVYVREDVSGTFRLRTSVIMLQSLSPRP